MHRGLLLGALALAFRPTWRLKPWVSYDQGHGRSFSRHGWSGTSGIGLVSLIFYL